MLTQLPDVAREGAPTWLILLAIITPTIGVIIVGYLNRKPKVDDEAEQLKEEIAQKWERRGYVIDELASKLATVSEARDAAVRAAEDAYAHKVAAELARQGAEAQERACRRELDEVRTQLQSVLEELERMRREMT